MTFEQDATDKNTWHVTDAKGNGCGRITRVRDGSFMNTSAWKGEGIRVVRAGPFDTLDAAKEAFNVGFG